MLKKIKEKFKELRIRAESLNDSKEESPLDIIKITFGEDYSRIEVKDYITCSLYMEIMNKIDLYKIGDNISFNIMWNGQYQKINRGIYYVIMQGDNIYNVLIDGNDLTIDERIKVDDVTEERIVRFNIDSEEYRLSSLKHDKVGSTFFVKFYNKNGTNFRDFELDRNVAFQDLSKLLNNLEELDVICGIVDVKKLKESILGDFGIDFSGIVKKKA